MILSISLISFSNVLPLMLYLLSGIIGGIIGWILCKNKFSFKIEEEKDQIRRLQKQIVDNGKSLKSQYDNQLHDYEVKVNLYKNKLNKVLEDQAKRELQSNNNTHGSDTKKTSKLKAEIDSLKSQLRENNNKKGERAWLQQIQQLEQSLEKKDQLLTQLKNGAQSNTTPTDSKIKKEGGANKKLKESLAIKEREYKTLLESFKLKVANHKELFKEIEGKRKKLKKKNKGLKKQVDNLNKKLKNNKSAKVIEQVIITETVDLKKLKELIADSNITSKSKKVKKISK